MYTPALMLSNSHEPDHDSQLNCITEIEALLKEIPSSAQKLSRLLDLYLEAPTALDSFLKEWIEGIAHGLLKAIKTHATVDVDGYCVGQFLPCQPRDVKVIIDWCLQCYSSDSESDSTWHAQNESMDSTWYAQNESTWHARYISALWAARVMLTPFPLTRLLPQAQHEELLKQMLKDRKSGREAQGVAYFLAMIFKRSDFNGDLGKIHESEYLVQIVKHASVSFLRSNLSLLKAAALTAPLKPQLKLLSHLSCASPPGTCLDLRCFFEALHSKDSSLRWTAAKALVRAAPPPAADEIFGKLVEKGTAELERETLLSGEASPAALHGFLLAMGRFIHRGLMRAFPSELLNLLCSCLRFDQVKGSYAVGSFVRDASCYVCWTAARYLQLSQEVVERLACALTCLALFDREVSCRRAGAAALQELIGRSTEADLLPLLEVLHFASVSPSHQRETFRSCLRVKPEWTEAFAEHLLSVTLRNFDAKVRMGAAEGMAWCGGMRGRLIEEYGRCGDDLFYRHGLLLAMASGCEVEVGSVDGQISHTLPSSLPTTLPSSLPTTLPSSLPTTLPSRLPTTQPSTPLTNPLIIVAKDVNKIPLKSLGFDLSMQGYLKLITRLPFQPDWLPALHTALRTKNDSLRADAVQCLESQAAQQPAEFAEFFGKCLRGVEGERDIYAQRGCLAALSAIPRGTEMGAVSAVLLRASKQLRPVNEIDRRGEALRALKRLLERGLIAGEQLMESFEDWLTDYSVDVRGDVGSLIRLEAMHVLREAGGLRSARIVDCLMEQRWGRIEKLREVAKSLLAEEVVCEGYFRGLLYTAGGLDAHLAGEAVEKLRAVGSSHEAMLCECLAAALKEHNGRLQLPAIVVIERLKDLLSEAFLKDCSAYLMREFVPKQAKSIRKLMVAFRALKGMRSIGEVEEFLKEQGEGHEYPAIRQLIIE